MLQKATCLLLLLLALLGSIASNETAAMRSGLLSSHQSSQGMGDSHRKSDIDLYGAISAFEGPHARSLTFLNVSPSSFDKLDFLTHGSADPKTAALFEIHADRTSTPLRI